ncbi:hypothetical protein DY000_02050365 [Brassica cretica]|uniref:Uncharacterized protein n=1 Tax=Brassica cretica TaxID=69181 RepID=A0ABQ7EYG3_BRACR|nr:hypothetical protein DY000_02050365 [Brassica cretica]
MGDKALAVGEGLGDGTKKKGVRKALFKQTIMNGGNPKKKFFQAVISTRKQAPAKAGTLQGDGSKQSEDKGPSNPDPSSSKP